MEKYILTKLFDFGNKNQSNKEEQRINKHKQFITMTSIIFTILFIFSTCIIVIASNIGTTEVSSEEIRQDGSHPNSGNFSIAQTVTYNETKEPTETKSSEVITTIEQDTEEPTQETEEMPVATEETKNYTEDDLYYLAVAVCREAGGESEEIQLLVANVIINRVNSSIYPDTIYDVLTQYKQYGTMWKYGVSFPNWATEKVIEQCYSVAQRILDGERYCPENVLFQAEFKQGSGIFKQFGDDYYFCYYG